MINDTMIGKVNSGEMAVPVEAVAPVMATPGAFVAGVVMGGKAAGALVGAAGFGATVANAMK
jgi:hypothetical protein